MSESGKSDSASPAPEMGEEEAKNGQSESSPPSQPSQPAQGQRSLSSKIFLRQLPEDTDFQELQKLVNSVAPVLSFEQSGSPEHPTAIVTMESADGATLAITRLNNYNFQDTHIKATIFMERRGGGGGNRGRGGGRVGGPDVGLGGARGTSADMPLRMVVDARFVGAIIGQGGANIREITRESKARCVVDVARGIRDQNGGMEKVINIYGQPENCSKAALRILAVVQKEAAKEMKETDAAQPPELKLRAHNQLVGRLIGKGGSSIKKIMEESGTTIFVSNDASGGLGREMSGLTMERTITIRGPIEAIAAAEERISAKLRQCWENDMINAPHMAYAGPHPLIPQQELYHHFSAGFPAGPMAARPSPPLVESVHLYVPNNMVGALIGTKGVHIRNIMRLTGAQIRIEGGGVGGGSGNGSGAGAKAEDKSANANANGVGEERLVIINGTQEQQYKAQFWIYQRVCEQGFVYFDEVRLVTEVAVPTRLVGRIIGKSGQNVRELQRMTGATVKIPDTSAATAANADDDSAETIVRITANFNASQAVQARLRQLVTQFHLQAPAQATPPHPQQQPQPQPQPLPTA